MWRKTHRILIISVCCIAVSVNLAFGDETLIEIADIELDETEAVSFVVKDRTDLHITAVGAERKNDEGMYAYPWIIDAKTREMVWSMDEEFTRPVEDSKWLRQYDDRLRLNPGTYTLYYHACSPFMFTGAFSFGGETHKMLEDLDKDIQDLLDALGVWLDENGKKHKGDVAGVMELANKLYVSVAGNPQVVKVVDDDEPDMLRDPVVVLSRAGNDAFMSEGFSLTKDMDLEIYAIGEYSSSDREMVDWGWIVDAETREHVWEMHRGNTDWAGGHDKNRRSQDRQHFPSGDYVAFYVTDGSHTYEDWNASPPFDPEGWGLRVFVTDQADREHVRPFEGLPEEEPIVRLVRVGNNELVSETFLVEETTPLRIYAIGEYDRFRDQMVDFAWIVRADDGRKYWIMEGDKTEPAGGAAKNRRFDGVVQFEPGEYVLYYTSDGSHSCGDGWNASPPHDQKSYGVSVFCADPEAKPAIIVREKGGARHPHALAEIIGVGDGEKRRARFSLTSPTRVEIYALGEGTRSGMDDYGWIENESTGDIVWEMTYRKTAHAGGAQKNRMVNQKIILDKGSYVVHYVTDDSHAFPNWNAAAPDDPSSWGIVLARVERSGN